MIELKVSQKMKIRFDKPEHYVVCFHDKFMESKRIYKVEQYFKLIHRIIYWRCEIHTSHCESYVWNLR